jgi:RimJ/RimL family protein N-acetyltransferase
VTPTFRPYRPEADEALLVDVLTTENWTYRLDPRLTEEQVRAALNNGEYVEPHALTFLIEVDGAVAGFVRAFDLDGNDDPQLDFRLRADWRGKGIGTAATRFVTETLFRRDLELRRIEAHTRRDNTAMRRALARCGYVREGVYRLTWPDGSGGWIDGIGYAILRQDWETGTTTPVDWSGV